MFWASKRSAEEWRNIRFNFLIEFENILFCKVICALLLTPTYDKRHVGDIATCIDPTKMMCRKSAPPYNNEENFQTWYCESALQSGNEGDLLSLGRFLTKGASFLDFWKIEKYAVHYGLLKFQRNVSDRQCIVYFPWPSQPCSRILLPLPLGYKSSLLKTHRLRYRDVFSQPL